VDIVAEGGGILDNNNMSTSEENPKNEFVPGPAWRAAEAAGIDMSLIEENLAKTPWERIQDHDQARSEINLLRQAIKGNKEHVTSMFLLLAVEKVQFVVVGNYAAAVHGVHHMSNKIEICIPFTDGNLACLAKALDSTHPVHRLTPQKLAFNSKSLNSLDRKNLYLSTDLGVVDCLGEVLGIGNYDAVKAESMEVKLATGVCRILTIPALIRAKQAMGRPHDLLTITELKAIQERNG
jgi:hypothetical protein